MNRTARTKLLGGAAAIPLIALVISGCGGGGTATASPSPPKTAQGGTASVGVAKTGLGKVLVDSRGRTLYLFKKDTGARSSCSGGCAAEWPPAPATAKPTAGSGANAQLVGTVRRSDGSPQLTYGGHPLYRYVGDQNSGDTNGQGLSDFGAAWWVVSPAGDEVTSAPSGASGY
jgi:predicted lipoprotein with Yx(FWY)xxD motif